MSQDYVKEKALEAIEAASEDPKDAAQLLRVWSENDDELKKALIKPFLLNICSLAIQRATTDTSQKRQNPSSDNSSLLSALSLIHISEPTRPY